MNSKRKIEQFDDYNYFIDRSCDDLEVNLPEVIENINLFKKILNTEDISFEQLAYMVLYDIGVFEVNKEKQEDLRSLAMILHNKYPKLADDEFLIAEKLSSFVPEIFEESYCVTKNKKSAKAKKLALGLIREEQKSIEEEAIKKFYEE